MAFRTALAAKPGLYGRLRLAQLLELSEGDFERRVREVEANPLFADLVRTGVVALVPYPGTRFAARRFGGWGLRTSSGGLRDLLDGQSDLVQLMQRIGRERFEEFFLRDEGSSNEARASACGIAVNEARRLREFVDRVYIQAEFERPAAQEAAPSVFSAVAGIEIDGGRPVVAFFNGEIWKGRYRIDATRRTLLRDSLPALQLGRLEGLLRQLEFLDRRKTTLYRVLEALVEAQAEFLTTGEPARRRPLTQRALASQLDIDPSVLNRLISNKSIQLPWGLEASIKTLVPSAKSILRDRLFDLAVAHPGCPDEKLREIVGRLSGARLSRRSIAQYRKDCGLVVGGKKEFAPEMQARLTWNIR